MALPSFSARTTAAHGDSSKRRSASAAVRMFRREECVVAPLSEESTRRWRIVRLIGAVAALLVAIGGWGGGAVMTQNPITSVPVINLLSRAPFSSVGLCLIGTSVIVVAWLTMMRYALPLRHYNRGETAVTQMTEGQTWTVIAAWVLPLFFTAPLFS